MSRRISAIMPRCAASLALSISFAHDCLRRRLRLLGASTLQALQHITEHSRLGVTRGLAVHLLEVLPSCTLFNVTYHRNTADSVSSQSTKFHARWPTNRSSYEVTEAFFFDAPLFVLPVQLPVERLQMQLHDIAHHDRQPGRRDADGIRVAVRGAPRARPDI